ncbi:hypothetical protein HELRODRAFT_142511, partial [Helobdella robusta]|uniref:Palmitoyltransferase n=1 Tax=Helobdella robusta TaxID=6412 RepID=T1EJ59_HELRO
RNSFFQLLYLMLVSTFHSAIIYDGLAILRLHDPHSYHLPIPLIICSINVLTFLIASYSNPGIITQKNVKYHLSFYKFDSVIFRRGDVCSTCKFMKPARSKHCKITDRCIYKFDHYCVWIGNAIGGNNHRYFLLLLFTLAVM